MAQSVKCLPGKQEDQVQAPHTYTDKSQMCSISLCALGVYVALSVEDTVHKQWIPGAHGPAILVRSMFYLCICLCPTFVQGHNRPWESVQNPESGVTVRTAMFVLGIQSMFSRKVATAFNHWATSPASGLRVFCLTDWLIFLFCFVFCSCVCIQEPQNGSQRMTCGCSDLSFPHVHLRGLITVVRVGSKCFYPLNQWAGSGGINF